MKASLKPPLSVPAQRGVPATVPSRSPLDPPDVARAQGALSQLLLTYVVALTALATLSPFDFQVPSALAIDTSVSVQDVTLNLLLMLPAGFLYALMRAPVQLVPDREQAVGSSQALPALLWFTGMSLGVETLQLALPARFSSPVDVVANGLGAGVGAWLLDRLRPWLGQRIGNEMTLRMPLSHLFYLLSLLMVIDGLMARQVGPRLWLLLPLGMMGALVASAVFTHRLRAQHPMSALRFAGWLAAWFSLVSAPGALRMPALLPCGAALVFLTCLLAVRRGFPEGGRRFELPTLRALAIPGALYLLGLSHGYSALSPLAGGAVEHTHQGVFDAIELLAALTVLGYGVAEGLGRSALTHVSGLAITLGAAASLVGLLETLGAALSGGHVRLWLVLAALPTSALGALVYRRELALVQALAREVAHSLRPAPASPHPRTSAPTAEQGQPWRD